MLRHDISEAIYLAYTAAQPVPKGKINNSFNAYKKHMEELRKEFTEGYDELKHKKMVEEGRKTWDELENKKKVKI